MALNMMGVAVSLLEKSAQRREVGVSEVEAAEVGSSLCLLIPFLFFLQTQ